MLLDNVDQEVMTVAAKRSEAKRELHQAAWAYDVAVRREYGGRLCGVDEAGRGPLAGPVVAAAVILPADLYDAPYFDSKQLTIGQRERAYDDIRERAIACGIGIVAVEDIDRDNILQATYRAMREALLGLSITPDLVMVDGCVIPGLSWPQRQLIHGDAVSQSIGAASILAKVTRDRIMIDADQRYPGYGFARHKGYGTREHLLALQKLGPCPLHRMSFAPVQNCAIKREVWAAGKAVAAADRRRQTGARAEEFALSYLLAQGYQLCDRNWRTSLGEVDLIMKDRDTLVFVEVRSRNGGSGRDLLAAAESVHGGKRARLRRLGARYVESGAGRPFSDARFDVVAVTWSVHDSESVAPVVEHFIAAF